MHAFAHPAPWALLGIIVTSALGALVMCLLVLAYGFQEEPPAESGAATKRRVLLTRVGHALGASCFAIVAMLAVMVSSRPSPLAVPAPDAQSPRAQVEVLRRQLASLEARLGAGDARVGEADARLDRAESRLSATEGRLERAEAGVGVTDGRLGAADSRLTAAESRDEATAARMDRLETRLGSAVSRLDRVETRVAASEVALRQVSTDADRPPRRPAAGPPSPTRSAGLSASPSTETGQRAAVTNSGASEASRPAQPHSVARPKPSGPEEGRARPAPREAAKVDRPQPERPQERPPADRPQSDPPIADKLRGDWQTIKREGAAAGDEIKKAFRDLWDKISR